MLDSEFVLRLIDRFEAYELVELLGISIDEIIEAFEDKLEERYEAITEYMENGV